MQVISLTVQKADQSQCAGEVNFVSMQQSTSDSEGSKWGWNMEYIGEHGGIVLVVRNT